MSNSMLKAWQDWYNEADMPMQDENGEWYDAETGISWKASIQRNAVLEKDPLFKESLASLTEKAERRIQGTEYSINKHEEQIEYVEAVKEAKELVAYYYAAKSFKKKFKKQDLVDIINRNTEVSRIFNKVKVSLKGEN